MKEPLIDPELEKSLAELFKKFISDLVENPREVNKIMGEIFPGLLARFGIDRDFLKDFIEGLSSLQKNAIRDRLTSLEIAFLMNPVSNYDNEFSGRIDKLFTMCKKKNLQKLKAIFLKPRMQIFQKMLTGFERSWRIVDENGLPKEAAIDNKVHIVKSLSETAYKELLTIIQEMMQLAFDYQPTDSFGKIINQLEGAPIDLKIFINRTAYNIRNADSHESVEIENDQTVTINDDHGTLLQKVTEEDLNKTISWLSDFTNNVFYALQKNYFELLKIENDEDRIEYLRKTLTKFLYQVLSRDS